MRRRVLIAAAFAGLLIGLWMAWPGGLPDFDGAAEAETEALSEAPARLPGEDPHDTGGEPVGVPAAPPAEAANAPEVEEVSLTGTVYCMVKGGNMVDVLASAFTPGNPDEGMIVPVVNEGFLLKVEAPKDTRMVAFVGTLDNGTPVSALLDVVWVGDRARCQGIIEPDLNRTVKLSGAVLGLLEGETAWLQSCLGFEQLDGPDGRFELLGRAEEGVCRVQAFRLDGALRASTDMLRLPIDGDEEYYDIRLYLPEADIGGIGARVEAVEQGVYLPSLLDNGPAAAAGIRNGEVITEVDGQSLAGLELTEAIGRITGPVGSEATLTVLGEDGSLREVQIERDWIE